MKTQTELATLALLEGKVIIYPTETILGIGCIAFNKKAIERIYQIKNRDHNKPLLVLVNNIEMVRQFKKELSPLEETLLLSSKPTTVILENVTGFPAVLTGENHSLGFRITSNKTCLKLIEGINTPLVSTSANFSNEPTASCTSKLPEKLLKAVDFTIESKPQENNNITPSRIIKVVNNEAIYIRK